jgi:hypothetical protein
MFDAIGQQWLTLDSLLTIKGPPDFSIEPAYPKHIYNDIRTHSGYQTIISMFHNAYDPDTFRILCNNIMNVELYNNDPHRMDDLIDRLPQILTSVQEGIDLYVGDAVSAAMNQIVLAKVDKIDYAISFVRDIFHKWDQSHTSDLRHQLAYHLRQIEELITDVHSLGVTNAYVNAVLSWIAPKGPSSVSSTVYGDLVKGSPYYTMLHDSNAYAMMGQFYNNMHALTGGARRYTRRKKRVSSRRSYTHA